MSLKTDGLPVAFLGKTKQGYYFGEDKILLSFKSTVTGDWIDGKFVENPGGNDVSPYEVDGLGRKNLGSSIIFFELLEAAGIPTHMLDFDLEAETMLVKKAEHIGKGKPCYASSKGQEFTVHGLECVVRFRARGSFLRRPGNEHYVNGEVFEKPKFEITLKDDANADPLVTEPEIITASIMSEEQYNECMQTVIKAATVLKEYFAGLHLDMDDIKFEVAIIDNKITIIDEISAGIMRVYNQDVQLEEEELADVIITEVVPALETLKKYGM